VFCSPGDVSTARLVGGDMDGVVVEIEVGAETLEFGPPLVVFGSAPAAPARDELPPLTYRYRFAGVEDSPEGPRALFAYVP
jgi:hypothetical protein